MKWNRFFVLGVFFIVFCSLITAATSNTLLVSQQPQGFDDKTCILTNSEYIIFNPYESVDFSSSTHYKANLHTHTTQSDGDNSVQDVIVHYALVGGYHILALTDHNRNTWPWSTWLAGYTPDYVTSSSAYYPTLGQGVLAVSGNEPSRNHHHGSLLNDYAGNGANLDESFQYISDNNGVSLFYHPGRYTNPNNAYYEQNWTAYWYNEYFDTYRDILLGMEVYNCGNRYGPTIGYKGDVAWWDLVNSLRDADDLVWGFSNDDMHNLSYHAFRNYQHFLMNELTEEELRMAMQNGAFYFSYEPFGASRVSSGLTLLNISPFQNRNSILFTMQKNRVFTTYLNQFTTYNVDNKYTTRIDIFDIFSNEFANHNTSFLRYGQAKTPKITSIDVDETIITIQATPSRLILWFDNQSRIVGTGSSFDVSGIDSNFVRAVACNIFGRTYTQPFGIKKT